MQAKTKKTAWIVFSYAILIFIGGIIGHSHSASKASLISGVVFGSLLLASSWLMFQKKPLGTWMALILAIILEGFFTWRFAKTLHFLPSGLLSLMSLAVIILVALKVGKRLRASR
ncbi:MAG: TMEM14 family protein [Rhabdochlamydiaceae bacterium]|nr:TMEM14 family protein [Rhabdochlamydiaceae bacterium]